MPRKTPQKPAIWLAQRSAHPSHSRVSGHRELRAHNTTERVADITRRLLQGEHLSTRQVADDYGLTMQGARALLGRLSPVLNLACCRRVWYRINGAWEPWS